MNPNQLKQNILQKMGPQTAGIGGALQGAGRAIGNAVAPAAQAIGGGIGKAAGRIGQMAQKMMPPQANAQVPFIPGQFNGPGQAYDGDYNGHYEAAYDAAHDADYKNVRKYTTSKGNEYAWSQPPAGTMGNIYMPDQYWSRNDRAEQANKNLPDYKYRVQHLELPPRSYSSNYSQTAFDHSAPNARVGSQDGYVSNPNFDPAMKAYYDDVTQDATNRFHYGSAGVSAYGTNPYLR